jgi:hypothetical protein
VGVSISGVSGGSVSDDSDSVILDEVEIRMDVDLELMVTEKLEVEIDNEVVLVLVGVVVSENVGLIGLHLLFAAQVYPSAQPEISF